MTQIALCSYLSHIRSPLGLVRAKGIEAGEITVQFNFPYDGDFSQVLKSPNDNKPERSPSEVQIRVNDKLVLGGRDSIGHLKITGIQDQIVSWLFDLDNRLVVRKMTSAWKWPRDRA